MKKPFLFRTTAFVMLAFAMFSIIKPGQTQTINENYRVVRGERPPIDLQSVSSDAYEDGIVLLKFKPEYAEQLEQQPATRLSNGLVRFNIEPVDRLNDLFRAQNVKQEFLSNAFNNTFTQKHKAWGFHLWYRLTFESGADIKTIVAGYRSLDEIEYAAPEFKKVLYTGVAQRVMAESASNPENSSTSWTTNDPRLDEQWHYNNTGQTGGTPGSDIKLFQAWDIEKGSSDLIVAVIDEGIQYNHPDLAGNMWSEIGYNFVSGNSNINPGDHGTHVAGTIAALNDNSLGVAGIAGGSGNNDGIRLMSCQVFSGMTNGGFHLAPIWAADNGAAISQNSWGYSNVGVYDQNVLDAIDYFNVNGGGDALIDGGITIFAAGNDNATGAWYPGYYSGTFAVAATNHSDVRSYYSNYGAWVDISAPGGETNTASNRGVLSTMNNSTYGFYQGTSMACPHVSGVAALVASHVYGLLTPEDIAEILMNSTDDHYAVNPSYIGQLGSGRLNAYQALIDAQNYLTGIMNPSNISATTLSASEISVSWNKNPDGNNVMLAWSTENVFGIPDSGMVYQPGSTLPGGGTILYKGGDTEFLHLGLEPASQYFYRLWSYNDQNTYSSGRSTSAFTGCEVFQLPFEESFEQSSAIPVCWSQEYVSASTDWAIGAGNGGSNPGNAYQGTKNTYFKVSGFTGGGNTTRLVSPELNLAGYQSTELNFHYTNQLRTLFIFNYQDELRVKYKTSLNGTWQTLATYNSNVANWTQVTLTLPEASPTYYIAFEAVSNLGHGVCIDNITVTGTGATMPVVSTSEVTEITSISAVSGGNVTWNGGSEVSQRGVCWSTVTNPTISDDHTTDGSGEGSFVSQIQGLNPNTQYYLRAYAVNDMGTAYGNQISFTTLSDLLLGDANCDGIVNVIDVIIVVNHIVGNNPQPFCFENADVNADGIINVFDAIGIVNIVLNEF